MALMLQPQGVNVHWITDGIHDRTGLNPAGVFIEPENRRGPQHLPLVAGDWNKARLTLIGDIIAVALNDQLIYERAIEPSNLRTFGLFHDANRTTARVRNITWRGNWPRELPELTRQELADVAAVADIDRQLAELATIHEHDFSKGFASSFRLAGWGERDAGRDVRVASDGSHIARLATAANGEYLLESEFRFGGDFDIRISFDKFETRTVSTNPESHATIIAGVVLDNPTHNHVYLVRKQHPPGFRQVEMGHAWAIGDNHRHVGGHRQVHDGPAGTFRFVRREDTIYCMFADGDSLQFRILAEYDVPPGDVAVNGLRLTTNATGGAAVNVVWKKVTVRAERD